MSKGVALTTHGLREQALATHLADALAWQLRATSVVVRSGGLDAPGALNHDLSPVLSEPENRRYMEAMRARAHECLSRLLCERSSSRQWR